MHFSGALESKLCRRVAKLSADFVSVSKSNRMSLNPHSRGTPNAYEQKDATATTQTRPTAGHYQLGQRKKSRQNHVVQKP
eukprot:m.130183 g.130183  ORF g.130183 m.130183 type:complete len:80 (-) comp13704_c0_seq3:155-394(-)